MHLLRNPRLRQVWPVLLGLLMGISQPVVPACAAGSPVSLERSVWLAGISAGGRYVSGSWNSAVDLKQDLGYGSGESLPSFGLVWKLDEKNALRADFFRSGYGGLAEKKRMERFSAGPFTIDKQVTYRLDSRLDINYWKFGWVRQLHSPKPDGWKMAVSFDIATATCRAAGRADYWIDNPQPALLAAGSESWRTTAPLIGFQLSRSLSATTELQTEFSGLTTGWNQISFLDARLGLRRFLNSQHSMAVTGGYRLLDFQNHRVVSRSVLRHLQLSGPYFGLQAIF